MIIKFIIVKIVLLTVITKSQEGMAMRNIVNIKCRDDLRKVVSWNVRLSEEDNNKGAPVI